MVLLSANFIRDLHGNLRVLPFISLTLTPLIMLHVFTIDLKLTRVVKLQIKNLFKILTLDFFDVKSRITGKEPKPSSSLLLIGYKFISLTKNMGIVFLFFVISILFLLINLALYIWKSKVVKLDKNHKLTKSILLIKNLSETLSNYLAVNQIISIISLVLYLQHEYYE